VGTNVTIKVVGGRYNGSLFSLAHFFCEF